MFLKGTIIFEILSQNYKITPLGLYDPRSTNISLTWWLRNHVTITIIKLASLTSVFTSLQSSFRLSYFSTAHSDIGAEHYMLSLIVVAAAKCI